MYQADIPLELAWMRSWSKLSYGDFHPVFNLLNVKYLIAENPLPYEIIPIHSIDGCGEQIVVNELFHATFSADKAGLNRLDIRFAPTQNLDPEATIHFSLRAINREELIAQQVWTGRDLAESSTQVVFFEPNKYSTGEKFIWTIDSSTPVELCLSLIHI